MCDMNRIILIDVDNLIDELEELADSYVYPNCSDFAIGLHNLLRQQGVDAAIEVVRKQKSVDPVKHGHWEYLGERDGAHVFECSECHDRINTVNPNWLSKYCSGCGAKMDGDKNETN